MATSGTATFNLDLVELVEEAYERAGSEMRTGYDLKTARRSLNLLFADWANRGLNMWTFEEGSLGLLNGVATYALPADTVDLLEHVVRTGSGSDAVDANLSRISLSTYANIFNKASAGVPVNLLVTRTGTPSVTLWPVPDADAVYTLVYWRMRRIQDASGSTTTMDVPFRFVPALTAGLAYYLALKVPSGYERLPLLKAQYDEAWQLATEEDREKAPVRLVPRVSRL
jgi:hypothetical protein